MASFKLGSMVFTASGESWTIFGLLLALYQSVNAEVFPVVASLHRLAVYKYNFLQLIVCCRIIGWLSSSLQIISMVLYLPLTAYILADSRPQRASFRDVAVGKYVDIKYGVHKCCSRLACWITSAHSPIHVYRLSDVYLYKKGNVCKSYCYFTWKVGFF